MWRGWVFAAALALAPVQGLTAPHDTDNPSCPPLINFWGPPSNAMTFRLDESSGRRILVADGGVDAGAAKRLTTALAKYSPVDEIWIRSPGGEASEGPKLGKVIRKAGLPTRVPAGWGCASACNFMFLGGVIRSIDPGGVYAVHMFTQTTTQGFQGMVDYDRKAEGTSPVLRDIAQREQDSALLASEQNDYMIRMGVSRKLLSEVMYQQKSTRFATNDRSTIRCLTAAEQVRYNVINAE